MPHLTHVVLFFKFTDEFILDEVIPLINQMKETPRSPIHLNSVLWQRTCLRDTKTSRKGTRIHWCPLTWMPKPFKPVPLITNDWLSTVTLASPRRVAQRSPTSSLRYNHLSTVPATSISPMNFSFTTHIPYATFNFLVVCGAVNLLTCPSIVFYVMYATKML